MSDDDSSTSSSDTSSAAQPPAAPMPTFSVAANQGSTFNKVCVPITQSLQLLYEDGTPMANAEFQAVFGTTSVKGTTDGSGCATINVRSEDTFRLVLGAFPEIFTDSDSAPAPTDPSGAQGNDGSNPVWPHTV